MRTPSENSCQSLCEMKSRDSCASYFTSRIADGSCSVLIIGVLRYPLHPTDFALPSDSLPHVFACNSCVPSVSFISCPLELLPYRCVSDNVLMESDDFRTDLLGNCSMLGLKAVGFGATPAVQKPDIT